MKTETIPIKIDKNKFIELINSKNYGPAFDYLSEISLKRGVNQKLMNSDLLLIKGILWELLGHFQNAKRNYKKSLISNHENALGAQFMAQILSKLGNYPKALIYFEKFFNIEQRNIDPLKMDRSIIGFRDRTEDIEYINSFQYSLEDEVEVKNLLLGIINFSMFKIKLSLDFFEKLKRPGKVVEVLSLIGHYLLNLDEKLLIDLSKIQIEGEFGNAIVINKLLQSLKTQKFTKNLGVFRYSHKIPDKIKDLTKNVEGWLDYCEGNLLYQLSKDIKIKDIRDYIAVEIGSYMGRSSILIAQGLKDRGEGFLISVDPHLGIPYYHPKPTFNNFLQNIQTAKVEDYIKIYKETSEECSSKINNRVFLLFLDGDHEYKMVKKDINLWGPKVMAEGIIAFHDAVQDGPFRLINELISTQQYDFLQIVGNIALVRKRGENNIGCDVLTILNQIILHIFRQFHLDFHEKEEKCLVNQIIKIINYSS